MEEILRRGKLMNKPHSHLQLNFLKSLSGASPAENKLVLSAFLQVIAQIGIRNSELTPSEYNIEGEKHEN